MLFLPESVEGSLLNFAKKAVELAVYFHVYCEFIEGYANCCAASSDGYVYDYYTVKNDIEAGEDIARPFPLVQVDENDDYYDGPDHSDYETDDSNAEHNPWNDYPDEEESEDEDETVSSNDKSEVSSSEEQYGSETDGVVSFKYEDVDHKDWTDYADPILEGDIYSEFDVEASDDEDYIW